MKNEYLILLAGVAAAYMLTKKGGARAAPKVGAQLIPLAEPNGWQYFTDGTAISPDGTYYYQGQMVWNPMM